MMKRKRLENPQNQKKVQENNEEVEQTEYNDLIE